MTAERLQWQIEWDNILLEIAVFERDYETYVATQDSNIAHDIKRRSADLLQRTQMLGARYDIITGRALLN
jgi:hypothetical protein